MPYIKYKANCRVCIASKLDPSFRKRVRKAAFDREEGDETLGNIAEEYGISTNSMYNHVKKHITKVETDGHKEIRVAKKIIDIQTNAQKELELQLGRATIDEIDARPAEIASLDEYIALCAAEVRDGKMKITPNSFLGAVKIKTDWAGKQQSNKIEIMRTIAAFASGAKKKEGTDGNTIELTESADRGEDEARSIYRATFGDATPQGSEEIYPAEISTE